VLLVRDVDVRLPVEVLPAQTVRQQRRPPPALPPEPEQGPPAEPAPEPAGPRQPEPEASLRQLLAEPEASQTKRQPREQPVPSQRRGPEQPLLAPALQERASEELESQPAWPGPAAQPREAGRRVLPAA